MVTIEKLDALTLEYAERREAALAASYELTEALAEVRRAHTPKLTMLARRLINAQESLHTAIESSPEFFEEPGKKSIVLHGIKVGWQKGKDSVACVFPCDGAEYFHRIQMAVHNLFLDDMPEAVELIKACVKTTHKPVSAALSKLDDGLLGRLGYMRVIGIDSVLIKPVEADGDAELKNVVELLATETTSS